MQIDLVATFFFFFNHTLKKLQFICAVGFPAPPRKSPPHLFSWLMVGSVRLPCDRQHLAELFVLNLHLISCAKEGLAKVRVLGGRGDVSVLGHRSLVWGAVPGSEQQTG